MYILFKIISYAYNIVLQASKFRLNSNFHHSKFPKIVGTHHRHDLVQIIDKIF